MRAREPHQSSKEQSQRLDERERLARLLKHAFPLGESGSFTGLLEAIGDKEEHTNPR